MVLWLHVRSLLLSHSIFVLFVSVGQGQRMEVDDAGADVGWM